MWSRLAVSVNRSVLPKTLLCSQNRCIHRNILFQTYKNELPEVAIKKESKSQNYLANKSNEIVGSIRDRKTPQRVLYAQNDPHKFGSFNRQVRKHDEPDEGDLADDEYYRNIPLRRDQLKQVRYHQMIEKFIRDKRLKEAIDVVEVRMKEDRVKPDYRAYQLLIMECARWGYTKKAFKLYNQMKRKGLARTGPTYAALFTSCANSLHPKIALEYAKNLRKELLQSGYNANDIIYNCMIKAFGRCGDIETAFLLVDEMKERKVRVSLGTMNHLLQVCCSDKEYGFRHALLVWHKIYLKKLRPNKHSFNLMIRCTRDCGIGDINEMRNTIAGILKSSIKLKPKENKLLITDKPSAPLNSNDDENKIITEQSDPGEQVNVQEVCNQMPNLLSKLPHLGSVVQLSMVNTAEDRLMLLGGLSGVIAEMEATKSRPSVKTFSQLLYTIPSTREAEHDLIIKMNYMRVRADTDFFNLLMKRRILRQDYDGATKVLDMIDKVNLDADIATYGIMAMGCVSRKEARDFIEKLTEKGVRVNNEILGALLKNATYRKDYDYVMDVLQYAMNEEVHPSWKFYELVAAFKRSRYNFLQKYDNDEELIKFNRFYGVYKKWKVQMELDGLSRDEVSKLLYIHPWQQLKQAEGDGIEIVKNKRTRRYWKRQHTVEKLTLSRLDRLHSENQPNGNEIEQTQNTTKKENIKKSNEINKN